MKKVLFLCAAVIAALNMNAAVRELTCAQAAAECAQLADQTPGTDSVSVTGYVTSTDGKISRGQQTFWMDDTKGTTKTFEAYWADLPQDIIDNNKPLNVGDKVVMKGFLMRYGTTYEMKNGDITVLERAVVHYDTIPATVCEAITEGEALSDGDNSEDYFNVLGTVSSLNSTNDTYHTQNLYMTCDENSKTFQVYNATVKADSGVYAALGDTIRVIGRLKKYGTQVEILGDMWIVAKGAPIQVDTIRTNVADAVTAGMSLADNTTSTDVYVVTGYVDSIAYAYSAEYGNMSFFMCDNMTSPTYEFEAYKAVVAQAATIGSKVELTGNLKKYVSSTSGTTLIEIEKGACEILELAGLEQIVANPKAQGRKMIVNGRLYLIKDGVAYDALGNEVK